MDHVFTRSDEVIADMNVRPPGVISDHSFITWTLPFTHQPPIAKRKTVQSWKRVNRDELRQSIVESDLCTAVTSDISAEMMFRTYDRVLREISNKLAPPRETTVRVQPIAVWYDDESRLLRRRSHALERKYRRTGLASDRILWVQHEKTRHKANRVKENAHWLGQISEHSGQPRKLWKAFSSIMGLDHVTSTSIGSPSAQDLLDYFVQKIETIRKATGGTPATTKLSPSVNIFSNFEIFSTEDVRKLIMSTRSKSCSLDPIPTEILKKLLPELLPFITDMCNKSMQEGCLPASQKHAIISPIIKKAGMDAEDLKSYRPISNLTYMSKLIERMVYRQITTYLEANHLLPKFQSGFRARHSTETAVLKVLSDIFTATDQGSIGLLGLLDMSAAFDTVDHEILLLRLESSFGISGTALAWLRSFLSGRTQRVVFNGGQSLLNTVTTGVPQASVGPLLFLLYTADIPLIAGQFGLGVHCYADDGQLYIFDRAGHFDRLVSKVTICISEIDEWMSSNRLKLNTDKTQFIWLGTRQQLQKIGIDHIQLGSNNVKFQTSVGNLGVTLDSHLSMKAHVLRTCRTCYYQLRQLRSVRRSLSFTACTSLVHAFITSRLDYCNSLLAGISVGLMNQLQSVIRVAARLVMRKRKFDPISNDIRDRLHWLPVKSRIDFKLGLLVYKCLHGEAPSYLAEMLEHKSDNPALHRLRNTANRGPGKLVVPRTRLKTFGPRSFATTGPSLWNSLPTEVTDVTLNISTFKIRLKTFLFKQCFPDE